MSSEDAWLCTQRLREDYINKLLRHCPFHKHNRVKTMAGSNLTVVDRLQMGKRMYGDWVMLCMCVFSSPSANFKQDSTVCTEIRLLVVY